MANNELLMRRRAMLQAGYYTDTVIGTETITMLKAKANGLKSLIANGGTEHIPKAYLDSLTREGAVEQRNLPKGYRQLEYIEGDGRQRLDTGVLQSNTEPFSVTFQALATLTSAFMGAISGGTNYSNKDNLSVTYNIAAGLPSTGAYSVYCDGNAGHPDYSWNGGDASDKKKHTIKYTGLNVAPTLDGVAMTQLNSQTLVANNPTVTTWLFGRNNTGTGTICGQPLRMFDVTIGTKYNGIPALRESDGAVGMWDTVTQTLRTSDTEYPFIAGPTAASTPDRPMDLWCNNGKLKVSRNLFNENLFLNANGWSVSDGVYTGLPGTLFGLYGVSTSGFPIHFEPSTQYKIKYTVSQGMGVSGSRFRVYYTDNTYSDGPLPASGTGGTYTITTTAGKTVAKLTFAYTQGSSNISFSNVMLEEGSTATPYMPYGQIYTSGTPEVLTVIGKNLFDKNTASLNKVINPDGSISDSSTLSCTDFIPVIAGQTYIRSNNGTPYGRLYYTYDSNKNFLSEQQPEAYQPFTIPSGAAYIRFNFHTNALDTFQLELGSTATPYEPYHAQTASVTDLLAVGTYKDTDEIINGLLTHKVGIKVLDGTENWSIENNVHAGVPRSNFYMSFADASGESQVLCTAAPSGTSGMANVAAPYCRISSSKNFNICPVEDNTTFPDLVSWATWLAAQHAAGTPVIIIYPLATPTTETVTKQLRGLTADYNNVDIQANVTVPTPTLVTSTHTTPSPDYPLDIRCNNGVLGWNGSAITVTGTQEEITISGKNLYNKANGVLYGYPTSSGTWSQKYNENAELTIMVKLKEGETYTATRLTGGGSVFRIQASDTATLTDGQSLYIVPGPEIYDVRTFTVPTGYPYVLFYVRNGYNASRPTAQEVKNAFQVELGPTATPYEPYHAPQTVLVTDLLASGDYKDTQEVISGLKKHKVGIKVLTGTESAGDCTYNNYGKWGGCLAVRLSGSNHIQDVPALCTRLAQYAVNVTTPPSVGFFTAGYTQTENGIFMRNTALTSRSAWMAELSSAYASMNPYIVIYPLATETTESVTPQPVAIAKGTNVATITQASMTGLGLSATYKRKK